MSTILAHSRMDAHLFKVPYSGVRSLSSTGDGQFMCGHSSPFWSVLLIRSTLPRKANSRTVYISGIPSRSSACAERCFHSRLSIPCGDLCCRPIDKYRVSNEKFISDTSASADSLVSGRALISDIWDAKMRGKALAIFTVAPFAGPALGPTVAGFIGANTDWRILFWVLTGVVGPPLTAFCPS